MKSNGSMNRVFRVVWNATKCVWQAVVEFGKGKSKGGGRRPRLVLAAGSFVLLSATAVGADLPTGGSVVAGVGSISQSGSAMTINQASGKMAVDWQSFNIGQGSTVQFNQPSASSVALNRVLGSDVSVIQGILKANGQVFLINPNGVLFTPTAQVNAGAIVASTLNMKTEDFMAGNYRFEGASSNAITNQGNITVANGGSIVLIAARIANSGALAAKNGNVLLGAASKVTLDLGGPVKLIVEQGAIDALIESGGAIRADAGTVLLTAKAAGDLAASVINHTGLIEANSLSEKGGRVVLEADRISLAASSKIETKGGSGGGEVLVGGSWQNGDPALRQATQTTVAAGAVIDASATQRGDGGTVVVWSDTSKADSLTTVRGSLRAQGGALGGNGGRIETSGYRVDTAGASVSASAAKGDGGLWLIDPNDVTIDQTVANGYVSTLNGGTSVLNTVGGSMTVSNNVSIAKTGSASTATLTLQSTGGGYINIGSGVTISDTVNSPLNVVLETAGPVLFADNGSAVNTVNIHGNLTIGAAAGGFATGNAASFGASYKDGVHIGNYVQLSAADITIKGKGFDYTSYTGQQLTGGSGVYVGTSAHLVGTGNVTVTGQGGAGSRASDGANASNMSQSQSSYPASNTGYNSSAGGGMGTATGNPASGSSGASANGSTGSTGNAGGDALANAGAGGVGVEILSSAIVHADLNLTMSGTGGAGGNGGNGGIGGQGLIGQQAGTAQGGQNAQGSTTYSTSWSQAYYNTGSTSLQYNGSGPYNSSGSYVGVGGSGYGYDYLPVYAWDSAANPHGGYYNGPGSNAYGGAGGNAIGGMGGTGGRGGHGSAGAIGGTGVKVTQATLEALQTLSVTGTSGSGGTGGSGNTGGQGGTGGAAGTAGAGGTASAGQNAYSSYWGSASPGSSGSAYQGVGGTGGVGGNAGAGGATGDAVSLSSATLTGVTQIDLVSNRGTGGSAGSAGAGGSTGPGSSSGGSNGTGASNSSGSLGWGLNLLGTTSISGGTGAPINIMTDTFSAATSSSVSSTGALTFKTYSANYSIGLGDQSGSGTLQLPQSYFWNGSTGVIKDGFSQINIGNASTATIYVGALTAADPLVFTTNASYNTNLYGALLSSGNNLTFNGNALVMAGYSPSVSSGSGVGGNILFSGSLQGSAANSGSLTVNAGTGTVTFTGAIGAGTTFANLTLTDSAAASFNSTLNIGTNLSQTNAAIGTTTFANTVTVGGAATLRGTIFDINNSWSSTGATSFTNSGLITKSATGNVLANGGFSSSGNISLASNITTVGTNLSIGGNLTIAEGRAVTLSTGTAAGTRSISVTGSTQGTAGGVAESLSLIGGIYGDASFTGALGSGASDGLASLTITSAKDATFGQINLSGALTQTAGAGTTTLGNTSPGNTVTVGSASLAGTAFALNNAFTSNGLTSFINSGLLSKNATGTLVSAQAFSASGGVSLGSNLTSTTGGITIGGALTLPAGAAGGDVTILANDRSSNISLNSTITGNNINLGLISGGGTTTVTGVASGLGNLRLQEDAATSTGKVSFLNNLSAASLTSYAQPYAISLTGASNTITAATAFLNTGILTLGDAVSDAFAFTNGINATAPSVVNIIGAVNTTNSDMSFGKVVLTGNTTLSTSTGAGNILVSGTLDGAYTLGLTAGTGNITLQDTVGASSRLGAFTISSAATSQFDKAVKLASATMTGTAFNLNGAFDTTGATTITNAGTLTVAASSPVSTGTTFSATGAVSLASDITTINSNLTIGGDLSLAAPTVKLSTGSGAGNISLNSVTGNSQSLTLVSGTGSITSSGAIGGVDILSVQDGITATPGSVIFNGNLAANTLTTQASNYAISLLGSSTVIQNPTTFTNTGALTLGNGGDVLNFVGGLVTAAPSSVAVNGTIQAQGTATLALGDANTGVTIAAGSSTIGGASTGDIAIAAVTLADGATLTLGTGLGNKIDVTSVTGTAGGTVSNLTLNTTGVGTIGAVGTDIGTLTVTQSGGAVFNSSVNVNTLALSDTTAGNTIDFQGNLTVNTGMSSAAGTAGYNVRLAGASNIIAGATTLAHTGTLSLGDAASDITTFSGGLFASAPGTINLFSDVRTTNAALTLGKVQLLGSSKLTSGNGNIRLSDTLNGAYDLTLTAGTGSVTFDKTVGDTTRLGTLTVASASASTLSDDVRTGALAVTSSTININGGSSAVDTTTTQTYNGSSLLGADTSLTASMVTFAGTLNSNGATHRALDITGNATLGGTVGATNDLGSLHVTGSTAINGGSLRTNADQIYDGAVTLGANSTLSTLSNGNVWFKGALNGSGGARTLTINANGTGDVIFDGAVGQTLALGTVALTGDAIMVNQAFASSGSMTVTNAGLFSTAAAGDITAATGFTQNGAGGNSLAGDISTTNAGISLAKAVVLTGPVALSTGSGTGDIIFSQTLDGSAAASETLNLTAGTGNVLFSGLVGNATELGAITINSAANVTTNGVQAASFRQVAGTGTTTVNEGTFAANGLQSLYTTTASGIDITSSTIAFSGAINTVNNGNLRLKANNALTLTKAATADGTGSVTLEAGTLLTVGALVSTGSGDINLIGGTGVTHTGSGGLLTGGAGRINVTAMANDITMVDGAVYTTTGSGNVTLTAANNVKLGDISTNNSLVTVSANNGAITDVSAASTPNIVGRVAALKSKTGVGTSGAYIQTQVQELSLSAVSGGIYVNNLGGVAFGSVDGGPTGTTVSGDIFLTATGTVTSAGVVDTKGNISINNSNASTTSANGITLSDSLTSSGAMTFTTKGGFATLGTADIVAKGGFSISAGSGISLAGSVATQGTAITLSNPVTLIGDLTLDTTNKGASTTGSTITLNQVDSDSGAQAPHSLTLTAGSSGNVVLNQALGTTGKLDQLKITSAANATLDKAHNVVSTDWTASNITINNAAFATTGSQSYSGAVTLLQDTALTGSSVRFAGSLNSSNSAGTSNYRSLILTGDAVLDASVGATYALGSLHVTGSTAINGGSVRSSADQIYDNALTLGANTTLNTLSNGSVWFKGTVDSSASVRNLTISANGTGDVTFDGAVGQTLNLGTVAITGDAISLQQALSSTGSLTVTNGGLFTTAAAADITAVGGFTQNGAGGNNLAGDIRTSNSGISLAKAVLLTGPLSMDTGAGAGNITFSQTLDGTTAATETLNLTAGTGNVLFSGLVGNSTELGAVTINSATNVTTNGVRAASFEQKAGSGTTSVGLGSFAGIGAQSLYTSAVKGIDITSSTISFAGGIKTVNNGNLRLKANNALSLTEAATADGSGNVSLEAGGLLTIGALVSTGTGNITLIGGTGVTHTGAAGGLKTTGSGVISVTALANNITMADGTVYEVDDGNVTLLAANNVLLGEIKAQKLVNSVMVDGDSLVRVTATGGAITDNTAASTPNVIGRVAALKAASGVGGSSKYIQTQVAELSLSANAGGIYVNSHGDVAFGSADGGTTGTTTSGDIVVTATGAITTAGAVDTRGAITLNNRGAGSAANITLSDNIIADGVVTFETKGTFSTQSATDILAKGGFVLNADGAINLAGRVATQGTDLSFNKALTLIGDLQLSTGAGPGNINLQEVDSDAGLDTPHSLTLSAGTGNVNFNQAVGATGRLDALLVTSANATDLIGDIKANSVAVTSNTININGAIDAVVTTGAQVYTGATVLGGNTTLSADSVTFSGTLDSSNTTGVSNYRSLLVTGDGVFAGAVGANYALGSLEVTNASSINGGSVRTGAGQTYGGAVTLGANTTLNTLNNGNIWFKDVLNSGTSARTLTINANGTGDVSFDAAVGQTLALGAVAVSGDAITLKNTLNTDGSLTITNAGLFTTAAAADITAATGFTQNGTGSNRLAGDIATSNAGISLAGAVLLAGPVSLSTGPGAGDITFSGTVDSDAVLTPRNLTLSTGAGGLALNGAVGGLGALGDLVIGSTNSVNLNQSIKAASLLATSASINIGPLAEIQTSGGQRYDGAVVLGANTTLTGSQVSFESTVDSDNTGGATPVSNYRFLNVAANAVFNGAVGSNYALGSLAVSGTTAINGGSIATRGAQTYTGAVTLGASTSLTTQNANISFDSMVDALAGLTPSPNLTLSAGLGDIVMAGAVGGSNTLGDVVIATARNVTANAITAANLTQLSGTGTSTFNGTVTLTGNFDFTGNNLSVNAPLLADGTVEVSNAGIFSTSANGDITAKDGFTQNGSGENRLAGDISTVGKDISLASAVVLTGDVVVSTGAGPGSVSFAGTVDGDGVTSGSLSVMAPLGSVSFASAVGGISPVGDFSVAADSLSVGDISAGNDVAIDVKGDFATGNITAGNDLSISTTGNITQQSGTSLSAAGQSSFVTTGGNLTLTEPGNVFAGQVNMSANDITLDYAGGDLLIGNVVADGGLDLSTTNGGISQASASAVTVTGVASLSAQNGGLPANISLTGSNNDFGVVNASGADIALADVNGIELGNVSASDTFGVTAGGDIAQSASSAISVGGETTLASSGGSIVLTGSNNDFGVVNASAADIALADVNGIELGNVSASGSLGVTAGGDITQSASSAISVGGETTLASSGGSIALTGSNNDFGVVNASGADIALADVNGIELGNVSASGTFGVAAGGDITQSASSAISVGGETTLASSGGSIALTGSNNDFVVVNASGADIALADVNGIELGNVSASGTFGVTAGGDITQSASSAISVGGETTLASSGGSIALTGSNNDFGVVNASGADIAMADVNGIELGNVSASGTFGVAAGGDITQSASSAISVGGETTLASSGGSIALTGSNNDFGVINASGADIALADVSGIELGNVSASGTFGVAAGGDITQSASSAISVSGETTLASIGGSIALTGSNNDFGVVNASGADIALADVNGIELGNVSASGNLTATANGAIDLGTVTVGGKLSVSSTNGSISQSGVLHVLGDSLLNASNGKISLNNPANNFGGKITVNSPNSSISGTGVPALFGPDTAAIAAVQQIAAQGYPLALDPLPVTPNVNALSGMGAGLSVGGFVVVPISTSQLAQDRQTESVADLSATQINQIMQLVGSNPNSKSIFVIDGGIRLPFDEMTNK